MDVKYIPAHWKKMKDGLGDLIGLGRWGKGMIDDLKDITENLEDAESDIAKYDWDGVISFSHIDREGKYQSLFEDFKVLHDFSGKVGDIVDRTIDDPFHEDIDKFVTTMRDATISNYTTKNRIDATEQQVIYQRYGMQETREVPKAEVSLGDLLSGDNFYAEQLQLEYDMWKAQHPDQDFTQEEYRMAAVNMNAFEYESIKDLQHNKEFWANIGALAAVVGATVLAVVVPPVGVPLALTVGTAYGTMELGTAVTGKDWASGRELNTGERWLRGALSPLDIIPGMSGIKKFSSGVRMADQAANLGQFGLKAGVKTGMQQELRHVGDMVTTAGRQSTARLKSAGAAVKDRAIREAISAGKAADSMVTSAKNITSTRNVVAMDELGKVHMPAENTHFFENKVKDTLSKAEGVSVSSGAKGTGVPEINPKYTTAIDKKVTVKEQVVLPSWLKKTYTDGQYRTVITNEIIRVYRTFGGKAGVDGAFATTVPASNRITSKIDSALLPEWKNSRQYEAVIEIPKGTELNIGKVEQQMTQTETVFKGGGDQILLPQNWPNEWIKEVREVPSR